MISHLVSTIIPVFNRVHPLTDAVASVIAQDYRPIEIFLVDDGSTDLRTSALITRLQEKYPEEIRALKRPNGGPGAARETGRLAASGEFLQYLDSDDVLLPGKFTAQVAALRADLEADVAYGITHFRDSAGRLSPQPLKATGEPMATMFPRLLNERFWETATPLYRRSVCDRAGAWTSLSLEEDWEYDCRIAALGGRLTWCPMPVSEHRDHGGARLSRQATSLDSDRLSQRARAQTMIHGHARFYGLTSKHPAMARFARSLFLLARQCGAVGLVAEAEDLCNQSLAISRDAGRSGLDIRAFRALARSIGWTRAARFGRVH